MLTIALSVLLLSIVMPNTVQLNCKQGNDSCSSKKPLLQRETYPVARLHTVFTLNLTIDTLKYSLILDTGSSDLFVKGENLQGSPSKKISCPSCVKQNRKATISYLDGQLETYVYLAEVGLGNHHLKQFILVAYKTNSSNYRNVGGIVGLSFPQLAVNLNPSFLDTLKDNKVIRKKVYGLMLNFRKPNGSFITFGGPNNTMLAKGAKITYYDISAKTNEFRLKFTNVLLGDVRLNITQGLLDTGNTCISLPEIVVIQLLKAFNKGKNICQLAVETGNQFFRLMACQVTDFTLLPTFSFEINKDKYVVAPEYYMDKCYKSKTNSTYACQTLIETVQGQGYAIVGAAFFQQYYAVFDVEQRRIGLARSNYERKLTDVLA